MATKLQYLLIIVCIGLIIQGCGTNTVKVGFLMDDLKQERWEKDRDLFVQKVEELGGKVLLKVAEGDQEKQYEQAKELMREGIDVLVIVPVNMTSAANIVVTAHRAGIKVLSYDRLINNCNLDYYVSFDNVEVGRLQAEYLTTVKPQGNFAIIGGATSDNNSFLIRLGQLSVIQPLVERGDINIVYDQFVNEWDREEGYKHMRTCLDKAGSEIDAVLAANDALASGVIRALEENGLEGKVLVSGQDAELNAIQRIVSGTQTMTVYKPIEAIATTAAKIAVKLAKDNEPDTDIRLTVNNGKKLVPAVLLPSMVVNKETIKLTVVADGYLKEQKIFE
jgi:D-xylose transport system substrate-binding protein